MTTAEAYVLRSPAFEEHGGFVVGTTLVTPDEPADFRRLLVALGRPLDAARVEAKWRPWLEELLELGLVHRVRPALGAMTLDATPAERELIATAWRDAWVADGAPSRLAILGALGSPRWEDALARVTAHGEPTLTLSFEAHGTWVGPHVGGGGACPRCLLHRRLARDASSIEALAPTWRSFTLALAALSSQLANGRWSAHELVCWVDEAEVSQHALLRSPACPDCFRPGEPTPDRAGAHARRTRELLAAPDGAEPHLEPPPAWLTYGPLASVSPATLPTEGAFRNQQLDMAGVFAVAIDGPGRIVVQQPNAAYGGGFSTARRRRVLFSEAIERLALIGMRVDVAGRSAADLGPLAVPLASVIPPLADGSGRPASEVATDWTWATSLVSGEARLLPFDVMVAGRPPNPSSRRLTDEPFFTGGATHVSVRRAATHALLEAIERDAFMAAWYLRLPLRRLERRTLPADAGEAQAWLEARGVRLSCFDLAVELPVPTVLTVATVSTRTGDWVPGGVVLSGCAAATVTRAMERGVAEVLGQYTAQACTTGTQADEDRPAWRDALLRYQTRDATEALSFLGAAHAGPPVSSTDLRPADELDQLVAACSAAGFEPFLKPLPTDEAARLGLWPVKVLVPGLLRPTPSRASMRFDVARLQRLAERWGVPAVLNGADHPQA